MCDYQYRKLGCGHIYHIVLRWCEAYPRTAKPCPPNVTDYEYRAHESCSECRPRVKQPWEDMLPPTTINTASRPFKVQ
jgi:hypothetical protein